LTPANAGLIVHAMMQLRFSPSSPFVRKVRIGAAVLGLDSQIELVDTDTAKPSDSFVAQNPLGKIPALLIDDGGVLFDSRVILEYLDHLAGGGKILPRDASARFDALRLQALCDGALDAAVLIIYENRYRPAEMHVESWVDRQRGKIGRALAVLEKAPPAHSAIPTVGEIALACLLGYGDFRFERHWRKEHPALVAWLDDFAAHVPAFEATTPSG
jgi:glutathione S-transferase